MNPGIRWLETYGGFRGSQCGSLFAVCELKLPTLDERPGLPVRRLIRS